MKNNYYLWLGAALLFLIVVSSFHCHHVSPYSESRSYSAFEGLKAYGIQDDNDEEAFTNKKSAERKKKTRSGFAVREGAVSGINDNGRMPPGKKVSEGFEDRFGSAPYATAPYASIDPFSDTPGSASCDKTSSGLSNSKGGLCLSKVQQSMLSTRGGNASGGESQIGGP